MSRTAAVVDSPQTSEKRAWWFLDTLVVEHLIASRTGPVVLEMTPPAGAARPCTCTTTWTTARSCWTGRWSCDAGSRRCPPGPATGYPCRARCRTPSGWWANQPARILLVHDNGSFLELIRDLGQPAGARQLPPPTGGPGLTELSRALAEHDVTVAGSSLTNEDAQAFMAEHG